MIRWLVSRSAEFRASRAEIERLREALQHETQRALSLQDRLEAAVEDRSKLWDMTRECISNERVSYQMQVNAQWQKQGFGAPFPEAPKLPESAAPSDSMGPVGTRPELPSTRSARAAQEFVRNFVEQQSAGR